MHQDDMAPSRNSTTPHSRNGRTARPPAKKGVAAARQRDVRLGFLIHDVSRMRRRAFDQFMQPFGITRAQWWVVAHLSRHDGMMQTQLADMLDVGKASLGTVIDRLETGGFVERRPDPVDRRAKRLYMTRKAHQLIDKMQHAERSYDAHILAELSHGERDELVRMLSLMKKALADFDKNASEAERKGDLEDIVPGRDLHHSP